MDNFINSPTPLSPTSLKSKLNFPKIIFILITLLTIGGLIGFVFIKQPFKNTPTQQIAITPTPTSTEMVLKYGISGKVYEATAGANIIDNFQKTKVKLDKKQLESYAKIYPALSLSNLTQISGTVSEVNAIDKSIRITTASDSGLMKIANNWQGNTLIKDPKTGEYTQKEIINIPKGDWNKMVELLRISKKVFLMCTSEYCAESIGGHIYLD